MSADVLSNLNILLLLHLEVLRFLKSKVHAESCTAAGSFILALQHERRQPYFIGINRSALLLMLALLSLLFLMQGITSLPNSRSLLSSIRQQQASRSQGIHLRPEIPSEYSPRFLQEEVCVEPSNVFDDDFYLDQFLPVANPVCYCEDLDEFDFDAYFAENPLETASVPAIQLWLDNFNAFASDLRGGERSGCRNECTICQSAPEICYYLTGDLETVANLGLAEPLTVDEILSLSSSSDDEVDALINSRILVFSSSVTDTQCATPTTIQGTMSTLCLTLASTFSSPQGVPVDEIEDASSFGCAVSVDGEQCNSCELGEGCPVLDCSNIESNPVVVDICDTNPESFPGVFFLLYEDTEAELEYSLGSCDGTAPNVPVSMPAAAPVTAPTNPPVPAPTGSPVSIPVDPTPTDAPASMPAAPVMIPSGPASTDPPVSDAPVTTPAVQSNPLCLTSIICPNVCNNDCPNFSPANAPVNFPTEGAPTMMMTAPTDVPVIGSTAAPATAAQLLDTASAAGWNAPMGSLWLVLALLAAFLLG